MQLKLFEVHQQNCSSIYIYIFRIRLDDATPDEIENLLKELAVMKTVGKHTNIISLLGCCTRGGEVMLIVEYAKYGNLRDYLRRKRPPGHVLSGSFEQDENDDSYKQDDNDELIQSLSTIDLILFCLQIAAGMEYLHSKKVENEFILLLIFNVFFFLPVYSS